MENYKKIVFLDIDGVLAGYKWLCGHRGFIDPSRVALLNELEQVGAEVVISSSWGYDDGRTEKALKDCGLTLPIIGYTDHVSLGRDWLCRGNEIEKWLQDNFNCGTKYGTKYAGKDFEYVIFDDNTDFLLGQKDNFIHTDERFGLTRRNITKALRILKRENI